MVPDIDRATRDPRTLEDLIDAVELYGLYVASLTGNIDLTTDAGICAARGLVGRRNTKNGPVEFYRCPPRAKADAVAFRGCRPGQRIH